MSQTLPERLAKELSDGKEPSTVKPKTQAPAEPAPAPAPAPPAGSVRSPATASKPKGIMEFLQERAPSLQELIPAGASGVTPQLLLDQLGNAMRLNPAISGCSPESIKNTVKQAAMLGLQFGYGGNTAEIYAIPYQRELKPEISYKGFETIVMRSGRYKVIKSYALWEGDVFHQDIDSGNHTFVYKPCGDQKTLIGAFAYAQDIAGNVYVSHMTAERLDALEQATRKGKSMTPAWLKWPDRMYRKSVIRRLCNELPKDQAIPLLEELAAIDVDAQPKTVKQLSEGLE